MAAFNEATRPDLDLYTGQTWSEWQHAMESETNADAVSDCESKHSKHDKEVARLKKKDFGLFGYCPAKDNFFVVMCEHCHLPFKPQAFHYHMEKHHKAKARIKTTFCQDDSFISKSGIMDRYCVKSPTPSESSNNSTGSVRNSVMNKPDKISLSLATKQTFHKVGSPTGSSPSCNSSPAKSNVGLKSFKWGITKGKQSPSSMSSGSSGSHKSFSSTKHPFQEDMIASKNTKSFLHHQVSPQHSKLSKHNSTLQSKLQKVKSENLNKSSDPSMPHHHGKHGSHGHRTSSKGIKRNRPPSESDLFKPIKHVKKQESIIEQNSSKDGLVVVLKKSAIMEKKSSKSPHAREPEKGSVSILEKNLKLIPSSPSPFRQYKHHHNPQIDIVKSSDRGEDGHQGSTHPKNISDTVNVKIPTKPKKNLPSKAREYDPNKHCGVLVSATPCTRSLTCKTHSISFKRKVSGRAKPYDELVVDHAVAKRKLKEESIEESSLNYKLPDATPTVSNRTDLTASSFLQIKPKSSTATPSGKTSSSAGTKTVPQPTSKSKSSILLFPRSKVPRHVDCWPEDFQDDNGGTTDVGQLFLDKHPSPLLIHQFGLQAIGSCRFSHNRMTDFQWRTMLPALKGSSSKKTQRPSHLASNSISQASCNFNPIPSVSRSVLSCLKNAKDASKHQKQQRSNGLEHCSGRLVNNSPQSHPTSHVTEATSQQRHTQAHRLLSKPFSVEGDIVLKRPSSTNHSRLQRSERRPADAISGSSSAKSPRCSMPLDHRLAVEEHSSTTNPLHTKFVQLTASSQIPTSANTTNLYLNSYQLPQHHAESPANEDNPTNFITSVPNPRPHISLQTKFYKVKRMPKERKNSLPNTVNQSVSFNNHIVHPHYSEDTSSSLHSTGTHQSYATLRPSNAREIHSTVAAPFSNANKQEVSVINGLTSNVVSRYAIPQSVTLTGTIGALMQTNAMVNNTASSSVKNVGLDQQYLYPGNFRKQLQHNAGDTNTHDAMSQGGVRAYISTADEVNGDMAADFI